MSSILAITTVGAPGGICLHREGESFRRTFELRGTRYSQVLLSEIRKALDEAQMTLSELDGIAVCIGPGSFTGIRVGMAVARSLAFANKLPIVGVTAFEALAAGHSNEKEGLALLLDARRGEVYAAFMAPGEPLGALPEEAFSPESLRELLAERCQSYPVRLVGDAVALYASKFEGIESLVLSEDGHTVDPAVIAQLGAKSLVNIPSESGLNKTLPVYIRRAV